MHLGDLENIGSAQLAAFVPHVSDERYPNGESPREFVERIMGAFYALWLHIRAAPWWSSAMVE